MNHLLRIKAFRLLLPLLIVLLAPQMDASAQNLTASGASHAPVNGTWTIGADVDAKPSYTNGGLTTRWLDFEGAWIVIDTGGFADLFSAYYYSFDANATPVGATFSTFGAFGPGHPTFVAAAPPEPSVSLGISSAQISETGGSATVTATLSGTHTATVTVNLGFTGTAGAGDRTLSANSIAIPAGQTTGTVTITAQSDADDEVDETVVVDILSVTNGTENGVQQVTTSIDDDDGPTVTLSRSAPVDVAGFTRGFVENGGTASLTATLSATSVQDVTVNLAYGGSATSGADYNGAASASIVIPAGSASANAAVGLTGLDDALAEGSEIVEVSISSVIDGFENGNQMVSTVILDDDHSPNVVLMVNEASRVENGEVAILTATADDASANTITVTLTTSGTATGGGTDYGLTGNPILIVPGSLSGTATLTTVDDAIQEGDETAIVDIASVTNGSESGTQQQTITIVDNELPSVTLGVSAALISETGGSATVTATLSGTHTATVTVNLGFTGTAGAGDRTLSANSIAIPAGQTTGTVTITAQSDADDEVDETVIVDILSVTNGTEDGVQQVTTVIDDDDGPTVTLTGAAAIDVGGFPAMVENGGTATVTATLSAVSPQDVVVTIAYAGTATNGADYNATASTTITVPATQLSATTAVGITATNDVADEGTESILVDISGVGDGSENGIQQIAIGILDDDNSPSIVLTRDNAAIAEAAGVATFTATADDYSANTITVGVGVGPGETATLNTDYTPAGFPIVISPGSLSGNFTITAIQDAIDEPDEIVAVAVVSVANGTEDGVQLQTTTITDDDDPPTVTISVDNAAIDEAGGVATATATLSGVSAKDVSITVSLATIATLGADFSQTPPTFDILAGATTGTFTVTALQDALDEEDEGILFGILSATNATVVHPVAPVSTVITDDDDPPTVTLAPSAPTISETGETTSIVTATLSGPSGKAIEVAILLNNASTASGNDFTAADFPVTGKLAFAAGEMSKAFTLKAVDDGVFESAVNETVVLDIDSPNSTNVTEAVPQIATVAIVDNEGIPQVTLSVSPNPVSESPAAGNTAQLTASVDPPTFEAVTVQVKMDPNQDATLNSDYSISSTTITIPAETATASVNLVASQDNLFEGPLSETVSYLIDSVNGGGAVDASAGAFASLGITDGDTAPVASLSYMGQGLNEKDGTTEFKVKLSAKTAVETTVVLEYGGSATMAQGTSTGDYSSDKGTTVKIPAGDDEVTVMLTSIDDTQSEYPNEKILISIASATNATKSTGDDASIEITMLDDDNRAPVAKADAATMKEDGDAIVVDVLANDEDEELALLIVSSIEVGVDGNQQPVGEASIVESGKKISFKPRADFNGSATVSYTLKDNQDAVSSEAGVLTVTVTPISDEPVAPDLPIQIKGGESITFDPLAGVTDPKDVPPDNPVLVGVSSMINGVSAFVAKAEGKSSEALVLPGGTVVIQADGKVSFEAKKLFQGADQFFVLISDDGPEPQFWWIQRVVNVTVTKADGVVEIGAGDNAGRTVLITPPSGQSLSSVSASSTNPDPSGTLPKGVVPQIGFLNFKVDQVPDDGTSVVTIELPPGVEVNDYLKYGRVKDPNQGAAKATLIPGTKGAVAMTRFAEFGKYYYARESEITKLHTPHALWFSTSEAVFNVNENTLELTEMFGPSGLVQTGFGDIQGISFVNHQGISTFGHEPYLVTYLHVFSSSSITEFNARGRAGITATLPLVLTEGHPRDGSTEFDVLCPADSPAPVCAFRAGAVKISDVAGYAGFAGPVFSDVGEGRFMLDGGSIRKLSPAGHGVFRFGSFRIESLTPISLFDPVGGIAVSGNHVYYTKSRKGQIYRYDVSTGVHELVAGTSPGFKNGSALDEARFNNPTGIHVSGDWIFVADRGNSAVRAIKPDGTVITWVKDIPGAHRFMGSPNLGYVIGSEGLYKVVANSSLPPKQWYSFMYRESDKTGAKIFPATKNAQGVELTPGRIELHFVDGERGDSDLVKNGQIDDPGMPSLTTNAHPVVQGESVSVAEDGSIEFQVLTNDSDPDGDVLGAVVLVPPALGTVEMSEDGIAVYSPAPHVSGVDQFTYGVTDGSGVAIEAVATVTITPENDAPAAVEESASVPVNGSVDIPILSNDWHPDNESFWMIQYGQPAHGTASVTPDLSIRYTPSEGFEGEDSFVYTIADSDGDQSVGNVRITVASSSEDGVESSVNVTTSKNTSVEFEVILPGILAITDSLGVDPSGFSQGTHGTVTSGTGTGQLVYTPDAEYSGTDQFEYWFIPDPEHPDLRISIQVDIQISNVNNPPAFGDGATIDASGGDVLVGGSSGTDSADPGDEFQVTLSAAPTDEDGDVLSLVWQLAPTSTFETVLLSVPGDSTGFSMSWQQILDVLPGLTAGMRITAYQRVVATDPSGLSASSEPQEVIFVRGTFTDTEVETALPTDFRLEGNYPNPFNPTTTIQFGLPVQSEVAVEVYDVMGRRVAILVNGSRQAGWHEVAFDASTLPSGTYLIRFRTPRKVLVRTMTLLK